LGELRQRVRAQLIDETVGKHRIRAYQDHIGLWQALKQRHIDAVLDRYVMLQEGESLRTPIEGRSRLAEQHTPDAPAVMRIA